MIWLVIKFQIDLQMFQKNRTKIVQRQLKIRYSLYSRLLYSCLSYSCLRYSCLLSAEKRQEIIDNL